MSILTVRISDKEKSLLARRAKAAGISAGGFVRGLIREKTFATSADLLSEMDSLMGDQRLRVKPRK